MRPPGQSGVLTRVSMSKRPHRLQRRHVRDRYRRSSKSASGLAELHGPPADTAQRRSHRLIQAFSHVTDGEQARAGREGGLRLLAVVVPLP